MSYGRTTEQFDNNDSLTRPRLTREKIKKPNAQENILSNAIDTFGFSDTHCQRFKNQKCQFRANAPKS